MEYDLNFFLNGRQPQKKWEKWKTTFKKDRRQPKKKNTFSIQLKFRGKLLLGLAQLSKIFIIFNQIKPVFKTINGKRPSKVVSLLQFRSIICVSVMFWLILLFMSILTLAWGRWGKQFWTSFVFRITDKNQEAGPTNSMALN
jgi:hypothetical protein